MQVRSSAASVVLALVACCAAARADVIEINAYDLKGKLGSDPMADGGRFDVQIEAYATHINLNRSNPALSIQDHRDVLSTGRDAVPVKFSVKKGAIKGSTTTVMASATIEIDAIPNAADPAQGLMPTPAPAIVLFFARSTEPGVFTSTSLLVLDDPAAKRQHILHVPVPKAEAHVTPPICPPWFINPGIPCCQPIYHCPCRRTCFGSMGYRHR